MTEKRYKSYIYEIDQDFDDEGRPISSPIPVCWAITDNDKEIAIIYGQDYPIEIVDLLNSQEEQIKSLKLENQILLEEMKEIRDKLTIYLEIKGYKSDRK